MRYGINMMLRLIVALLASLLGATANANPNLGPQKTAVIAVKFSATDPDLFTLQQIREMIFNSGVVSDTTSLNAYIKEISYDKTSLVGGISGDVFGWYNLNMKPAVDRVPSDFNSQVALPSSDSNSTIYTPVLAAALKAADGDIDFRDYSRIILLIDRSAVGWDMGTIGLVPVTTGDSLMPINASVTWLYVRSASNLYPNDPFADEWKVDQWPNIMRHEVGHNFGLDHAGLLEGCGVLAFCSSYIRGYGDPFDVMGPPKDVNGRLVTYSPHYNAFYKEKIGWLDSTSVLEVTKSGTYKILPLESKSAGYKAIKIPRPGNSQEAFYIEYRQRTGFDSSFDTHQPGNNAYQGALIRHVPSLQGAYPASFLVDTTPDSIVDTSTTPINVKDFIDAALTLNKTFTDGAGISVTTVEVLADSSLTIRVLPVSVSGFWPANGAPGSFIVVFGSDFVPGPGKTKVTVNGIPAPIMQVLDSSLLFFMLPAGDTAGPITVTTALSSGTSAVPFGILRPGVSISGIWPAQGPVGSVVFLFGTGYVPQATKVFVNGLRAPLVQVLDASMLFFIVPDGATSGPVSLQTSVDSAVSATPFMVLPQ